MSIKSFPEFGEVIEEPAEKSFPEFGEVIEETPQAQFGEIETPSQGKDQESAEAFKFFGFQPSAETIKPIRHAAGVSGKGLAKGLLGAPGEILDFGRRLMGIKEPTKVLPNTEDIGKMFDTLGGEEFNPQNLPEEVADRGFEFLGSILGLGGPIKAAKLGTTIGRNVLAAFAPAGASLLGEKKDLPPWGQAALTIGTSFLTHRLTGKSIKQMRNALYQEADSLSKGATVPAQSLRNNLTKLKSRISKGGIAPSDKPAIPKINELLAATKKGKIPVEDLMAVKRKINELRGGLFTKDLGRTGVKTAQRNLNDVSRTIDNAISEFKNPEFQKAYKQANQIHSGLSTNNRISRFISDHPTLSGLAPFFLKNILPGSVKTIATVAGAGQMGKFLKNIAKNPGYRKAYFNVLKNASREEVKGTASALKKFNKEKEKQD